MCCTHTDFNEKCRAFGKDSSYSNCLIYKEYAQLLCDHYVCYKRIQASLFQTQSHGCLRCSGGIFCVPCKPELNRNPCSLVDTSQQAKRDFGHIELTMDSLVLLIGFSPCFTRRNPFLILQIVMTPFGVIIDFNIKQKQKHSFFLTKMVSNQFIFISCTQ